MDKLKVITVVGTRPEIIRLSRIIPEMDKVRAIRSFRLLRPLRSLSAVPSMKILMNTLLNSMK